MTESAASDATTEGPDGSPQPAFNARRWLTQLARRDKRWQRITLQLAALQGAAIIAQAALLAQLFHGLIIEHQSLHDMAVIYGVLPLVIIIRALLNWAREMAGTRSALNIRQMLRTQLLERLAVLGPVWRQQHQGGALVSQLLEQVEALDGYIARYRPQQWLAVIIPVMILLAVFPVSWAAGLILLGTAPLIPLFMALVGLKAKQRQEEQHRNLARMSGHFLDQLRGLPTLQLFNAHHQQTDIIQSVAEHFRQGTMRVLRLAFLSSTVLEFFTAVSIALSAVYLGFSFLGHLNFGLYGDHPTLVVGFFILLLAPEFYLPLRELGIHYHAKAEAEGAAELLHPWLDTPSPSVAGGRQILAAAPYQIQFQHLHYRHHPQVPLIEGVTLDLPAQQVVAITGTSGSGKTTLLRLLSGQLAASSGYVSINGVQLTELAQPQWREQLGWMSQHPHLLAATLRENLQLAAPECSDEALQQALHDADLGDWFAELPEGLDTRLGDSGRPISGGQLRRIALARLLLRDAPIWLLDEPTASLDDETEQRIIACLQRAIQGRTVLLLTHREAPLALAHHRYRLQNGQLQSRQKDQL